MYLIRDMLITTITTTGPKWGLFFVTRLNQNASYQVLEQKVIVDRDAEIDGALKDEIITPKIDKGPLKAILITFKSLEQAKLTPF